MGVLATRLRRCGRRRSLRGCRCIWCGLIPSGRFMDSDPQTVVSVIREMKAAGKGIVGMKILGQGSMRDRQDEALKFALGLGLPDAFTIGAENRAEQEDSIRRIGVAA